MKGIPEGVTLREGTYDRLIWESVYVNNEYRLPDMFEPGDVVIDIGAHTGAFSAACINRGATIVACEPDQENYEHLHKNLDQFPLFYTQTLLPWAIWRDDQPNNQTVNFSGYQYPDNGQVNTGGGTVLCESLHCVTSFSLNYLLRHFVGRKVRLIKFDCEGSEFPILLHAKDLSKVQEIVGEFHEGYGHKKEELVTCLEGHGFTVTTDGPTSEGLGHFWARRA